MSEPTPHVSGPRPGREPGQPDINPARLAADPLLAEIAAMVSYMDLHIGRYEMKQLTTRQKELWADLVDADAVVTANEDPSMRPARRTVRWWRDYSGDLARPIGEEGHAHGEEAVCRGCGKVVTWDADIEAFWIPYEAGNPPPYTFHCSIGAFGEKHWALPSGADEPDPFVYADEGGERERGADQSIHYDEAAARVARGALLDVTPDHPHWHSRHDDFAALFEWAKQAVRPMRMTTGEFAGEIGALRSYPSPSQAAAFLMERRAARS